MKAEASLRTPYVKLSHCRDRSVMHASFYARRIVGRTASQDGAQTFERLLWLDRLEENTTNLAEGAP